MVDIGGTIGGAFSGIVSGTVGLVVWILVGVLFVSIILGILYYFGVYRKRFDITAKIISERAGDDNKVFFDKAAIINDKRNATQFLRLLNTKVELPLPKFNVFHNTNRGDYVEILRKSERDFRFLTPPEIDKDYIIKSNGKKFPYADITQREIENDISWIINRQKTNKTIIDPESMLMKLLAYAPQLLGMAMTLIIVIYVFKLMPDMLNAMKGLAETINAGKETTVIGSLIPLIKWKKRQY